MKYSGYTREFLTPQEAMTAGWYGPEVNTPREMWSSFEQDLVDQGFSIVQNPISGSDFQALVEQFGEIVEDGENIPILKGTLHPIDRRQGHFGGYKRKEREIDVKTGRQVADAKHLFHINPHAYERWKAQLSIATNSPIERFLSAGMEVLNDSLATLRSSLSQLEATHPGLRELHFPNGKRTTSFLRVVTYDGYDLSDQAEGENLVAGSHYDRGSFSAQLYATHDGLFIQSPGGQDVPAPQQDGNMHVFPGLGIPKLYMGQTRLPATAHEVRRLEQGESHVPPRTAIILFLDPAFVDLAITPEEAHLLTAPKL